MNERWAALVPELLCSDIEASLRFYVDIIGFKVRFSRPEDGFAYLELGAAELMLERLEGGWQTGALARPFGRGVNLQIEVGDVTGLAERAAAAQIAPFREVKTHWYRAGTIEHGQIEWLVQDPDGYLLRFVQPIGTRRAG